MPGSQLVLQSCMVMLQKLACTSSSCLSVQGKYLCAAFQQSVTSYLAPTSLLSALPVPSIGPVAIHCEVLVLPCNVMPYMKR